MAYKNWVINGLTPSWVEPVFEDDPDSRTLTLKCAAISDRLDADPITEIDAFQAITSEKISNDSLLNGGSKLLVGPGGHTFSVTAASGDGSDVRTWPKCALKQVKKSLDSSYQEDNNRSVIQYELVICYETYGVGGVDVYRPDYNEYPEITYHLYSDQTNPADPASHQGFGKEIGHMVITKTENIRRVEVSGCGDCAIDQTDCWLEVNGEKQYWHFTNSGDKMNFPTNVLPIGSEKLNFILDPPSNVITLQTSQHINPDNTCANNKGCWPDKIRLFKE